MSEDEFRKLVERHRRVTPFHAKLSEAAVEALRAEWCTERKPIDRLVRIAVEQESINGLGGYSMPSWVTPADIQMASLLSQQAPTYGEQGPDTDGTAMESVFWLGPDGLTCNGKPVTAHRDQQEDEIYRLNGAVFDLFTKNTQLTERIARKEAANEALVTKLETTLADMRSLQRQTDNWRAECQRLSALLVETQQELARRMALPVNALRHGGVR